MIPEDILQRIDSETDIVALASEFISLTKKGKNYMGLCPFHDEKSPSFSVSPEKNIAVCMGCRTGGRPIHFYRLIKNISFPEAASELAARIGIDLKINTSKKVDPNVHLYDLMEEASRFFEVNLFNSKSGVAALEYLANRKLSTETIQHFNLGFASSDKDQLYQFLRSKDYQVSDMIALGLVKQSNDGTYYDLFNNRLMFPISNSFGRIVGFSGRTLDKNDNIKYVNSPETPIFKKGEIVYHLFEASLDIRRLKQVVLYEGFFDVIAAYQAGFTNGIATMGTALTINQANLIKRTIDNIIVAFDGDKAGVSATIKSFDILAKADLLVQAIQLPDKLDPDDFIKKYGASKYQELLEEKVVDPFNYMYDHYVNITDFNNANDLELLLSNVTKMLETASPVIVSLYKTRLSTLLNIDINDIVVKSKRVPKTNYQPIDNGYVPYEPTEPIDNNYNDNYIPIDNYLEPNNNDLPLKSKETKSLGSKYENAEKRLLILMLRSKEWHDELLPLLDFQDYATEIMNTIKFQLNRYYELNDNFDLLLFEKTLSPDQLLHFNSVVKTDDFWINQIILSKDEINEYIRLVKETQVVRQLDFLVYTINEKGNLSQDFSKEAEEYILLRKRLTNS